MHCLKEFLYLEAFSVGVLFGPVSHLTDLWKPKLDWHVRSKDNGRGGFWYQLAVLFGLSLVIFFRWNGHRWWLIDRRKVCWVLPACPGLGVSEPFFHSLDMCCWIFTDTFVTTGMDHIQLIPKLSTRTSIHNHHNVRYWPCYSLRGKDYR